MVKKDPINRIVWNMDAGLLLDLFFKMVESERVPVMSGKDEDFILIRDWVGPFTWRSWVGMIPVLPIKGNDLVNPLPAYLMIRGKVTNRYSSFPLTDDASDIPVGQFAHIDI